jgi:hypothetical protein
MPGSPNLFFVRFSIDLFKNKLISKVVYSEFSIIKYKFKPLIEDLQSAEG